jgi:hypothetical protein
MDMPEVVEQAVARVWRPVDLARAVFQGHIVLGHRRSVSFGEMTWALPGGDCVPGPTLKEIDPFFRIIAAPSPSELSEMYVQLKDLGVRDV